LTAKEKPSKRGAHFDFYMDLLGHDILNCNQAVLGYLELICSNPAADKKSKAFAMKAITHTRTSTILIENVKRLIATKDHDLTTLKPIDLMDAVEQAREELVRFHPGKDVRLEMIDRPRNAFVLGGNYASDLILNVFVIAARLNLDEDIRMKLLFNTEELQGNPVWVLRIEDANAQLPPFLDGEGVKATYDQDVSRAVKASGMLFAKMIAENLGGDFEAHSIHHEPRAKGAIFTIALRRADKA
jgi:hypothetical protein